MSEKQWFVKSPQNNMIYGPYSLENLQQLLQVGKMSSRYLVSTDQSLWSNMTEIFVDNRQELSPTQVLPEVPVLEKLTQKFAHYQIQEELGRGGMGVVYKVCDSRLQRIVALKLLLPRHEDRRILQRFLQEARLTAQLKHPHIVELLEVGELPEPYFTMEYVQGQPLSALIAEGLLTVRQIVELFIKICSGMEYAHRQKIIHRDLKPQNILIDTNGQPKISDFGLALHTQQSTKLSLSGEILGTPKYISPEQADGKPIDKRSDIYSLGAIFYELLTGRAPFEGDNIINILAQLANNEPIAPSLLNPQVPEELELICCKCLSKHPSHRYLSAKLLRRDLERFLQNRPISVKAPGPLQLMTKWMQRNKQVTIFGSFITIALAVCAFLLYSTLELQAKMVTKQYVEACNQFHDNHLAINSSELRTTFSKAIATSSTYEAHWMHGAVCFVLKDYKQAQQDFAIALDLIPSKLGSEQCKLWLLLALCHAEQNQWQTATRYWQQAKSVYPGKSVFPNPQRQIYFAMPIPDDQASLTTIPYYYALLPLLPQEVTDNGYQRYFIENAPKPALSIERDKIGYLLGKLGKRATWVQFMLTSSRPQKFLRKFSRHGVQLKKLIAHKSKWKSPRICELKELLLYANGKWICNMGSPYWAYLPLHHQQYYAAVYQQAYAQHIGSRRQRTFTFGQASLPMMLLPPGQFLLGTAYGRNIESPQCKIVFAEHFWMCATEVTRKQYLALSNGQKRWYISEEESKPTLRKFMNGPLQLPATHISMYCIERDLALHKKLTLPNEIQWEYACSAGTTTMHYWGEKAHHGLASKFAWYAPITNVTVEKYCPHIVGQKICNSWGLFDMIGNVLEMCSNDYFAYKDIRDIRNNNFVLPLSPEDSFMYRGGSYADDIYLCNSKNRRMYGKHQVTHSGIGTCMGIRLIYREQE